MADRRGRRWPWVIGGIVVVAVVLAGLFWFVVVPHWRPPLHDGERYGVDVSAHQGEIDWRRVASDGVEFAYIKASEGGDFTDSRFGQNWTAAGQAGLDRGAYHFFTLCRQGEEQARQFLAVAPPDPGALPPAVDLELAGNCSRRPPASQVDAELRAFLEIVEAAWGQPALLYVRDDWESSYPTRARLDRPLWQFRFLRRPSPDHWRVWQIHGFAHVEGISGRVDLNIMKPPTTPGDLVGPLNRAVRRPTRIPTHGLVPRARVSWYTLTAVSGDADGACVTRGGVALGAGAPRGRVVEEVGLPRYALRVGLDLDGVRCAHDGDLAGGCRERFVDPAVLRPGRCPLASALVAGWSAGCLILSGGPAAAVSTPVAA